MLQKRLAKGESPIVIGVSTEPKIEDYVSKRLLPATPEEKIRQIMVKKLVEEYGYSPKQIQTVPEVYIKKGSKTIGPADIVVFHDEEKLLDNLYIIIEVKREDRTDGLEQLKSYMSPTRSEFGVWFNGKEIVYLQSLREKPFWREIPDIPKKGESLDDVGLYLKKNLIPATELKSIFETCHNYIYANEGLLKEKVFNEVLKLIFIKMADEKSINPNCEFRVTDKELDEIKKGEYSDFKRRITSLFEAVKGHYTDVFPNQSEEINLKPLTIATVVSRLQKYSLFRTPIDVKGLAFQTFVGAHERGERGEFFTPYPILELAVKVLNPKLNEKVLDPACGSGGFLVQTLKYVYNIIDEKRPDLNETQRNKIKEEYARTKIFGIDINPDLARVSKMRMIFYDDGHTGIFSENSLETWEIIRETATEAGSGIIKPETFEIIITNPPFGTKGRITSKRVLRQFELAHIWRRNRTTGKHTKRNELRGSQVPDILFIERCYNFLKDKGRMAIVVPDSILTNTTLEYVREWIKEKMRIIGVVSLPDVTFVPHGTGSKTSILFLQKVSPYELKKLQDEDYSILTSICEKIGYDVRGRTIYKRNEKGQLVDKNGKVVSNEEDAAVDTDIPEIINAFKSFKKRNNVDF